jgi:ADP-ribose pyrophosphatase YjhB (NUDIX family)
MLTLIEPEEMDTLSAQFGEPLHWARTMDVNAALFERRRKAREKKRAEIVLAIARPRQRVLLHTKSFYPDGVYRLLSGGVENTERVKDAASRELHEETGFSVKLERFLGIIEYEFQNGQARLGWVSYIFLTEETDAAPNPIDKNEQIAGFREVDWQELEHLAKELEQLPREWHDWGRFRALPHRLVLQAMTTH